MSIISVIIPVYNEEENLPILFPKLMEFAEDSADLFEFIFIDDGSIDGSFEILRKAASGDARIKVIRLSRNFGSHAACSAGFLHARGDACVTFPADLQDPPELIRRMAEEWKRGYEVVFSVKEPEAQALKPLHHIYYSMVRKYALSNMPPTGVDLCLIDRKVVDAITSMSEKNTSLLGLILWSGFRQTTIHYKKGKRIKGASKWTLGRKTKLFIDTFVSFSFYPIRAISVVGIFFAIMGFAYAFVVMFTRIIHGTPIEGWSSLMVVLLVVSGVQMIMLGILGEYLWRNFDESRKRPGFIICETIGCDKNEGAGS